MRDRFLGAGRQGLIAGLDIGTSKIACVVARPETIKETGETGLKILGLGHTVSRGIKKGAVVDIQLAEEAIRAAVDTAEQAAGVVIQKVWVNVSSGSLTSHHTTVEAPLSDHEITSNDLRRVMAQARASVHLDDRVLVHAIPVTYSIDGSRGIRDPRGMFGERLGVTMHMVSAAQGPLRNLMVSVKRCHLDVAGMVAAPYASALSTLVQDEMDLGVTLIDLGGGTTTIAVFFDGRLIYAEVLSIGGQHVTSDIARGLSTPLSHAERMKTLFGSTLPSPSDDRELIEVPQIGEDFDGMANQVPRSLLTGIIQPRIEETFEIVRDRVLRSGLEDVAGRRVVLTGGASELTGVREIASRLLDKPVRIGRPLGLVGVPDQSIGAAFSTCLGLVAYPVKAPAEAPRADSPGTANLSQISRLGQWLRANF